ncbi:membrane-associated proteins in eicosanoid and glutathione metabolism [Hesseltinella vesiculosa]|uniref:Glutathione S-transferase 3, mitochondrial n=1 Tax=Hesseltinella vesiculosa TaxID=101127 RepID=A0A1X2G4T7_9FUNG|nr:membrane-associated proteins in eicosanoid and glutathione metabolism [Hesseltinella vesiculosa]
MSTITLTIPRSYGYVIAVGIASAIEMGWLTLSVGAARSKARVPYPYLYADKEEAEKDENKHIFNCTQRAHQNTLEFYPVFTTLLLIGGLKHPELSAKAGAVFVLGRFLHAIGYRTGSVNRRVPGSVLTFGALGTLFYTSISTARQLLE